MHLYVYVCGCVWCIMQSSYVATCETDRQKGISIYNNLVLSTQYTNFVSS